MYGVLYILYVLFLTYMNICIHIWIYVDCHIYTCISNVIFVVFWILKFIFTFITLWLNDLQHWAMRPYRCNLEEWFLWNTYSFTSVLSTSGLISSALPIPIWSRSSKVTQLRRIFHSGLHRKQQESTTWHFISTTQSIGVTKRGPSITVAVV